MLWFGTYVQEGEPVEYALATREDGKMYATDVTGPDGAFVEGTPFDESPGHMRNGAPDRSDHF